MVKQQVWPWLFLAFMVGQVQSELIQSRLQNRHLQRVMNHQRITIVIEGVRTRARLHKPDPLLLIDFPEINHQFKVSEKIAQNVTFEFWHFPPIFVLLKLTCLVTLFDRNLHVFKKSPKWTILWHF